MKVGGQEGAFRVRVGELKSALRDGRVGRFRGQVDTVSRGQVNAIRRLVGALRGLVGMLEVGECVRGLGGRIYRVE
jgi:hypothetical protein